MFLSCRRRDPIDSLLVGRSFTVGGDGIEFPTRGHEPTVNATASNLGRGGHAPSHRQRRLREQVHDWNASMSVHGNY